MGLLKRTDELNATDHKNGHRRVYNLERLERDFRDAGLKVAVSGGYWLKTLSNAQIDEYYTPEMISAFLKLGEKYPDIAGEIYAAGIVD